MPCAIFAALTLLAISLAFIMTAVYPEISGKLIALVTGSFIVAFGVTVGAVAVMIRRCGTITSNEDLVYW